MMSAGVSPASSTSAACAVEAVFTAYPAFRRYAATNEAIDVSSSTTRIVCGAVTRPDSWFGRRPARRLEHESLGLRRKRRAAQRLELQSTPSSEYTPVSSPGNLRLAVERDDPAADGRDVMPAPRITTR